MPFWKTVLPFSYASWKELFSHVQGTFRRCDRDYLDLCQRLPTTVLLLLIKQNHCLELVLDQVAIMANSNRRRLSFVDFAHPQVWHKLLEYAEVTIAFTKLSQSTKWLKEGIDVLQSRLFLWTLVTDFTNQWAKICFLASSQLHHLVMEFRKKTETEIRGKYVFQMSADRSHEMLRLIRTRCHLGGMMYDLWESLLLESELESQVIDQSSSPSSGHFCALYSMV